jgi:hypothetical protein
MYIEIKAKCIGEAYGTKALHSTEGTNAHQSLKGLPLSKIFPKATISESVALT